MLTFKEKFYKEIIPAMRKEYGYNNNMAVPRLLKVTINSGTGQAIKDDKYIDTVVNSLTRISGQKPVFTKAKKSISAFKVRQGMKIGVMVTLRGKRMYDFIDKLINVSLPRVRDFRGLEEKSVDQSGNLTIGFKEHIVFPEIHSDEVEGIHGLEVTITTSARSSEEGLRLLTTLGFPFKKQ